MIIESVKKTNRLVTVEESWPFGSIGSEIANIVQREVFDYLDSPIIKVNSADVPMPYSSFLENIYLPQTEDIVNAVIFLTSPNSSYINGTSLDIDGGYQVYGL